MVNIIDLLPMRLLFVLTFGFLPIALTVYEQGIDGISFRGWVSFALIGGGAVLVYLASLWTTSIRMQTLLWPLLIVFALGLLVYRTELVKSGEFSDSSVERGGTDYEG